MDRKLKRGEAPTFLQYNEAGNQLSVYTLTDCLHMDVVWCKLVCAGYIGATPVLLAKPQTYMNLSGESVRISKDVMCTQSCKYCCLHAICMLSVHKDRLIFMKA